MFKCSKCKEVKERCDVVLYSKNSAGKKYYYCHTCNNERARNYRKTTNGKLSYRAIRQKHERTNREKVKIRSLTNYYVRRGVLVKPEQCELCQSFQKLDAHHIDYKDPLNIRWLCRKCNLSTVKLSQ